jgi:hypothetical protein
MLSSYKIYIQTVVLLFIRLNVSGSSIDVAKLPAAHQKVLKSIDVDKIGNYAASYKAVEIKSDLVMITLTFDLNSDVLQNDWQVVIKPSFKPDFNWAPHLTPTDSHIIDRHVFRTPALIAADTEKGLAVIPAVEIMTETGLPNWYMDMDALDNTLTLGMSNSKITGHVLYERNQGALYKRGKVEFAFYIYTYDRDELKNPFRKPLSFFWERWGMGLEHTRENATESIKESYLSKYNIDKFKDEIKDGLAPYVEHTYRWAFDTWKDAVWQEFEIDGKKVGAPVFIVNTTQSPNYGGIVNEREFRSVWNQAWFSSLRSASGLYRYARRTGNSELLQKANMTKELALAFPQKEGFFNAVVATEMEQVEIDGKKYNRSKGWDARYWGNSNRNPYTWDAAKAPYHILDMSWTATLMLRWYNELDKDSRLLAYAERYGEALLKKQFDSGFFPSWLRVDSFEPMEHLNDSPETSMSVTFLLNLYRTSGNEKYKDAALKAMDAVIANIIPIGRWEDFETYWSCCRYGAQTLVGKKVERNNMYKQCNFSMFWTAEALLECYSITKSEKYLQLGQRVLDELLMTQASWQPSYMYVNVIGGFGVMNCDGEWNDSRASLFAELIFQYGDLLEMDEYTVRGLSALRSSFSMMYCPENREAKVQWEKVWPFFNEKDYGFTMENYGHGGRTTPEGEGMGEFTIYDWGNGAAAEAYNRIMDKHGNKFK